MNKKIAVLQNAKEELSDVFQATQVTIYSKGMCWQKDALIELEPIKVTEREAIKERSVKLKELLIECKVIVGTLIIGVPYYVLSIAGYDLCEAEGFSEELLEELYADYCMEQEEEPEEEKPVATGPYALDELGNYALDLMALQRAHPEISSKKALLPFLNKCCFSSLIINCDHVMPWLENYLKQTNFITNINRAAVGYQVVISCPHIE